MVDEEPAECDRDEQDRAIPGPLSTGSNAMEVFRRKNPPPAASASRCPTTASVAFAVDVPSVAPSPAPIVEHSTSVPPATVATARVQEVEREDSAIRPVPPA